MNNLISEYFKIQTNAYKAIEEAVKAIIPPFDPDLGLTTEEFDKMTSDIKESSTKASSDYKAILKRYEIDQ
jgi:hypothetical protein